MVFALYTHHHHHPPTLTLPSCFWAPCSQIWACEDTFQSSCLMVRRRLRLRPLHCAARNPPRNKVGDQGGLDGSGTSIWESLVIAEAPSGLSIHIKKNFSLNDNYISNNIENALRTKSFNNWYWEIIKSEPRNSNYFIQKLLRKIRIG